MVFVKTGIRSALAMGSAVFALAASALGASLPAQASSSNIWSPDAAVPICTAPAAHAALAAKLSKDIATAMSGRTGHIAVRVEDVTTGVECRYNEGSRSHSASVIKATILAALLYWRQQTGTSLTSKEKSEATLMIEQSDNAAATYLWNDVGHARLQQFVNAAQMTETQLNSGGYWGLSNITARDELQMMRILTEPYGSASNKLLNHASRTYELYLMQHVIPYDYWGITAGVPSGLNVYVKNGWLNDPVLWVINSIGAVQGSGRDYKMAILTYGNPNEQYGINTVQAIAEDVNRDLNAGLPKAGTPTAATILPRALQGRPDEVLPAGAH
jgi:hypothetical protein